jgi:hypothetical protein
MIRINCTPQKSSGFNKQRGKKLVLKCVAIDTHLQNTLPVSAKGVFCQGVKNEQHAVPKVHMPSESSRTSWMMQKRSLGNPDLVAKGFSMVK